MFNRPEKVINELLKRARSNGDYELTDRGKNGALMMVIFPKAFVVIDVTFIKKCLSKFNFGPVF